MAKEIVIWCECDLEQDERVPAREYEVTLEGKTYTVDLCSECFTKHLSPLVELLDKYGQPVVTRVPSKGKPKKTGPAQKVEPNAQGEFECDYPGCGQSFAKPQGVGRHKLAHKDYAEVMESVQAAKSA